MLWLSLFFFPSHYDSLLKIFTLYALWGFWTIYKFFRMEFKFFSFLLFFYKIKLLKFYFNYLIFFLIKMLHTIKLFVFDFVKMQSLLDAHTATAFASLRDVVDYGATLGCACAQTVARFDWRTTSKSLLFSLLAVCRMPYG